MPSSTTTTRTLSSPSSNPTYSLPLTGANTPPRAPTPTPTPTPTPSGLLVEPLRLTGALKDQQRVRLTPAIGIQFSKDLDLKKVLEMEDKVEQAKVFNDLAYEIAHNGVAFFPSQDNLTPVDLTTLALHLGIASGKPSESTLHIHPTQELGENGLPLGSISSEPDKEGRQISFMDERSNIASSGWHTDISFEEYPANFSMLRMHTIPETGGDTLFSSSYALYDLLSPRMQSFLEGLEAQHHAEMFREQARRHGFKLRTEARGHPDNKGDAFRAVHPVIRTNNVTGLKALFVNKTFTSRINDLSYDESDALLEYLFKLNANSHDAQVRYRWGVNDLAIWHNGACQHVATFDFGKNYRAGDRAVCCGEKPYLDPKSTGRKEALAKAKLAQEVSTAA